MLTPKKKYFIKIDPSEREEIEKNIDWFSKLSPINKIRAVENLNQAERKLLYATRKLRRTTK